MGAAMKKINFNLPIFENIAAEFENFNESAAGLKNEKCSGGLVAIMALYRIDEALAFALMSPNMTAAKAEAMIMEKIKDVIYRNAMDDLTPVQRVEMLDLSKQKPADNAAMGFAPPEGLTQDQLDKWASKMVEATAKVNDEIVADDAVISNEP